MFAFSARLVMSTLMVSTKSLGKAFTFKDLILITSLPPSLTPTEVPVNLSGRVATTFLSSTSSKRSKWINASDTLSN